MLKVLTLNLNFYVDKHGSWSQRRPLIEQIILKADPDIIALQAVAKYPNIEGGRDQAHQLAAALRRMPRVVFEPVMIYADGRAEGIALLSRLPIIETERLDLTLQPNTEDPNKRALLHAVLENGNKRFHLFNAHFSWVAAQAEANINEALPYINEANEPALVVGDFNQTPDTNLMQRFTEANWTDVWAELHSQEAGYTFESNNPTIRIDYVWANRKMKPYIEAIEILSGEARGARLSDHLALLATFSF